MRKSLLAIAAAAVVKGLAGIAPASAADVVVARYAPRGVYVHPHYRPYFRPYYRPYWAYRGVHARPGYVATGPYCWRSARVRFDGAVIYRRICA